MIDRAAIEQIIAQYTKHGWTLRRVLLSEDGPDSGAFGEAEIFKSDLDALWFSRSSRPDLTAWELRHLNTAPYALVTGVPSEADREETDTILKETETRMRETLAKRRSSGN